MTEDATVVVLGGGIGGITAATSLRERLPERHRVVIVDRAPTHLFPPSLLWLVTGRRREAQITRPLAHLADRGIEVVHGDVVRIDPETRRVRVSVPPADGGDRPGSTRELTADHLVVSLGAELVPGDVPGLAEAGHGFYSAAGAVSLRDALRRFDGGRILILTATPAYKCPAAPYEAAMLIADLCRRRGIRDRTRIDLYAAEPAPMGVTGAQVSAGVRRMVEAAGIGYHPDHRVVEVDPERGRIHFEGGATATFDLLAYVPPHHPPRVVADTSLVDASGWVPVDRSTLRTRVPNVFAVGDITRIPLAVGKPLPMAGVFAERQAEVVARLIARDLTGRGPQARFDGHGECFIETGRGRAGFGRGDFYAEPAPRIRLHPPSRRWHLAKVMFEKHWLRRL